MHNLITLTDAVEWYAMSEPYTLFNRKGEEIAEVTNCRCLFLPDGSLHRVLADLTSANFPNVINKRAEINPKVVFVANPLIEQIVIDAYVPVYEYLAGKELPITVDLYTEGVTDTYHTVRLDEKNVNGDYVGRLIGVNGTPYLEMPYQTACNMCVKVPALTIKKPNTAIAYSDVATQAQLDGIPPLSEEAKNHVLRHASGIELAMGNGVFSAPIMAVREENYVRQESTDGNGNYMYERVYVGPTEDNALHKSPSGEKEQSLPWKPMVSNPIENSQVLLYDGDASYKLGVFSKGVLYGNNGDTLDRYAYTKYLQL